MENKKYIPFTGAELVTKLGIAEEEDNSHMQPFKTFEIKEYDDIEKLKDELETLYLQNKISISKTVKVEISYN